jgi:hypothetical protein
LAAPSILGDSFGQAVQGFQKRLPFHGRLSTFFGGSLFRLPAFFRLLPALFDFLPTLFRYFLHERSHHFHHLIVAVPFAQKKHQIRTSDDGNGDAGVDDTVVKDGGRYVPCHQARPALQLVCILQGAWQCS